MYLNTFKKQIKNLQKNITNITNQKKQKYLSNQYQKLKIKIKTITNKNKNLHTTITKKKKQISNLKQIQNKKIIYLLIQSFYNIH